MEKIDLDKKFEITPREMSDFGSKAMVALLYVYIYLWYLVPFEILNPLYIASRSNTLMS